MGILDDAIREHLELKRKHGVAEEELQRQEEEALGPTRREVAQQPGDAEIVAEEAAPTGAIADGAPSAVEDTALFDGEEPGASVVEPPSAESAAVEEESVAAEPVAPPEPSVVESEPPTAEPPLAEPPPADPPVADHTGLEPAPAEPDPDAGESLGDTEPHGFPALDEDEPGDRDKDEQEDLLTSGPEADELDVLEDTPDFLQETPEHDRLWFEQKPPRDFDFD
jgi:hypothetical protein